MSTYALRSRKLLPNKTFEIYGRALENAERDLRLKSATFKSYQEIFRHFRPYIYETDALFIPTKDCWELHFDGDNGFALPIPAYYDYCGEAERKAIKNYQRVAGPYAF